MLALQGGEDVKSQWNIAAKSKDEQNKVNVDLAASGVAYKERLNMPVVAEVVAREQPEHLRDYFMERVRFYREQSLQLPRASDPRYIEMTEQNAKS
ncbi:DNA polymerase III subunit theta [Klebsiella quasipneumoniae]|uniref:DNA polymerase III subunit theta n=1 Tax=Klebsiella quasipneumoniae TaxID=1463165 RepID=UPI001ABF8697|nr:DNA polymerase III subunit theta [Klebsiella quasipneumoniae]